NMTRRQKAAQTRRLIDISEYQGINIRGARIQQQRGVEIFGKDYETWTREQRRAAWEGFHELVERSNTSVSYGGVLAELKAASQDGSLSVVFYNKTVSDGMGGTKQVLAASIATTMSQ